MATVLPLFLATGLAPGGYKVDISRGQRISRVLSEWFMARPAATVFGMIGTKSARSLLLSISGTSAFGQSFPFRAAI